MSDYKAEQIHLVLRSGESYTFPADEVDVKVMENGWLRVQHIESGDLHWYPPTEVVRVQVTTSAPRPEPEDYPPEVWVDEAVTIEEALRRLGDATG